MAALRGSFSKTVFVYFGLAFVVTTLLVILPGERVSAVAIPRYPSINGDGDSRIEILRRSVAADGGEGEGMQDALKYLEELDKYYAQVARPR